MKVHLLSAVPLVVGTALWIQRSSTPDRQGGRHRLVTCLSVCTALVYMGMALNLPHDQVTIAMDHEWAMSHAVQMLLVSLAAALVLLICAAYRTREVESFCGPALMSLGLLSAVLLLRSQLLALTLLPAALVVLTLATPADQSAVRGASRFLALAALPIPFVLACFALLDRLAQFPDQSELAELGGLLVVPCIALWLTLFPFQGATHLWAKGQVPLAPAFLWIGKDWAVVCLLLTLWKFYPSLRTEPTVVALGLLGLLTAVISGLWSAFQTDLAAVLACAVTSELGIVVQGLVTDSPTVLQSALLLLIGRSLAILIASSALASLATPPRGPATEPTAQDAHGWWPALPLLAFTAGVLSLAGAPPLLGFLGRQQLYDSLRAQSPTVVWAWLPASLGILIGLVRSYWMLWRSAAWAHPSSSTSGLRPEPRDLPIFLTLCLLLVCVLWFALHPQPLLSLILDLARPWMSASPH